MGKPEGIIEDYLGKIAKEHGFLYYKFTSPAHSGVPDRILIGHGQTIFIELKRPKGKPRKLQDRVFENMRKHGATVYVVDTKQQAKDLITKLTPKSWRPKKHIIKSSKYKIYSIN